MLVLVNDCTCIVHIIHLNWVNGLSRIKYITYGSAHIRAIHNFLSGGGGGGKLGPDHCKRYRVGQNPLDTAEGSVQRREAPISLHEAQKHFFTFISQLSG